MLCSQCHQPCNDKTSRQIDDQPICLTCLYGETKPITIYPIGVVKNDKTRNPIGFGTTGGNLSEIHLLPGMDRFMTGLANETHLIIVWQLHEARPVKSIFARGWDGKRVGPFASRTPDRLTPIAITEVELVEVSETTLIVRGLDAVNNTPVLDIKVAMQSLK